MIDFELIYTIIKAVANPTLESLVKKIASKGILDVYKTALVDDEKISQAATGSEIAQAAGHGSTASISGNGNVIGNDNIVSGDKVSIEKSPERDTRTEKTFQRIAETSRFVTKQLELSYSQAREQAYTWFRFSIIAAVAGLLLIVVGIIVLLLGQTTEGIITAISSVVPNAIAALFFLQSKASNERVHAIQIKLSESREIHTAIEIANSIETKKERDKLKAEIIRKVIGFSTAG